jgi:S1-C subfamily serine protease
MARGTFKSVGTAILGAVAFTTVPQAQQPSAKKHLTLVCYWQNYSENVLSHLPSYPSSDGCEKYKEPTHCRRTSAEMFMDTKHDWERVTADGLIYTISCRHNCTRILVEGGSYDAETDGKLMWITFERPINKNLVETFEVFDISPMKEETAALPQPSAPAANRQTMSAGTGFFVSEQGHILTNAHVVSGCKRIQTREGSTARLVSEDDEIDLALLKVESESPAVATFRLQPVPRVGDSVIAFGFPLQGILSSEGNLSTGTVAAVAGVGDDPRFIQVSAPVQPGNSGSPLLDSSGDVIGVVEAKLDAVETLRIAGDIPQNVNFAIRAFEAIHFLERNHVPYHVEATPSMPDLKVADVAAKVRRFSVPLVCEE